MLTELFILLKICAASSLHVFVVQVEGSEDCEEVTTIVMARKTLKKEESALIFESC